MTHATHGHDDPSDSGSARRQAHIAGSSRPGPAVSEAGEIAFRVSAGLELRGDNRPAAGVATGDVVLLHGGGQTRQSWEGTAVHLQSLGWNVTTIDMRGHGESDWARDGDYSIGVYAEDLRLVLETFTHPPVVVGASLGGLTALVVAGECEESLMSALVLVDVVPRLEWVGVRRIRAFMGEHLDGFDSLDDVLSAIESYAGKRTGQIGDQRISVLKNVRLSKDGKWYWHWDPKFVLSLTDVQVQAREQRVVAAARGVRVPTLTVRGAASDVTSSQGIDDLKTLISHSRSVEVARARHMIVADANDSFDTVLVRFLNQLSS